MHHAGAGHGAVYHAVCAHFFSGELLHHKVGIVAVLPIIAATVFGGPFQPKGQGGQKGHDDNGKEAVARKAHGGLNDFGQHQIVGVERAQ